MEGTSVEFHEVISLPSQALNVLPGQWPSPPEPVQAPILLKASLTAPSTRLSLSLNLLPLSLCGQKSEGVNACPVESHTVVLHFRSKKHVSQK